MAAGRLGKYELLETLGRGAFGVVYRALDTLMQREVALKVITVEQDDMESVLKEARLLYDLRHDCIVQIHSVDSIEGNIVLDMEYMGQDLRKVLNAEGILPLERALEIVTPVLSALAHAHSKKVFHRDIKSPNIFVHKNRVKLGDFGIAQAIVSNQYLDGAGTYPYMAPENFAEEPKCDHRSDLWSVGVVLYEILTGHRPFNVSGANTPFAWKRVVETQKPLPLTTYLPDSAAALQAIIDRALAREKQERFASAQEFLQALKSLTEPSVAAKINPIDGAEIIEIPAGEFLMGSEEFESEKPQRRVYLDAYAIYKTPVTVKQFKKYCAATKSEMPPFPPFNVNWRKEDHPMVNISWHDARAYCDWAGADLPTEAQWEKAARGTDGRRFPWGNEWITVKTPFTLDSNLSGGTIAVTARNNPLEGASPYGVLDMVGNVWEWCADWYSNDYYRTAPSRNPTGPVTGTYRALRGGSWMHSVMNNFRCSYRNCYLPFNRNFYYGFRCVVRSQV